MQIPILRNLKLYTYTKYIFCWLILCGRPCIGDYSFVILGNIKIQFYSSIRTNTVSLSWRIKLRFINVRTYLYIHFKV